MGVSQSVFCLLRGGLSGGGKKNKNKDTHSCLFCAWVLSACDRLERCKDQEPSLLGERKCEGRGLIEQRW